MERWDFIVKCGGAAATSVVTYLYGGWSGVLMALLALSAFDYFTGFIAAGVNGELKSRIGLWGISRKVFIFGMVAVGHIIDGVLGDAHMFRDAVAYFYMANEVLSIIENGGKMGAPIPPVIMQAVEILKGKGGNKNGD
ncbi:holin family protein [Paenibacillus alvei]|uniref:phage holin family protein n=1 Tax=Paenibacillus alvei TaxID=44250 RepID=UPI0022809F10|nr:phage holin family protein [Paenibacillus alvei]MCY7487946.1 phage holin family protein [Paenibacillus alvei]